MNKVQRFLHKAIGGFGFSDGQRLQWTINTAGEWVYQTGSNAYINEGYKSLPNLYGIISLITSKSTIVPFEIFTKRSESKYQKYKAALKNATSTKDYARCIKLKAEALEKVEGTELERLLHNPNNYQSGEQLSQEIDGYKLLTGNSVVYQLALTEGGKPKELHNIPSPLVDMIVKGTPFEPEFNYKINYLAETLPGEDVLHFRYWNPIASYSQPGQQYWGLSPLKSCEKLLGKYKDADITQGFQFKNMGPAGMISGGSTNPDTNLTEEQAVAVQDRFDQQHGGTYKAGKILVTPSNLKWVNFGLSPVDLNINETKNEILSELCNVYHVPIGLFSDKNSTENNMIESRKTMITDAVIPLVEARKEIYQSNLVPRFGDYIIEYDYSVFHEMQEDLDKLADTYSKMWWTDPNEKRAATGFDKYEDPAADVLYIPSGLVPLADVNGRVDPIDEEMLDPNAPQ